MPSQISDLFAVSFGVAVGLAGCAVIRAARGGRIRYAPCMLRAVTGPLQSTARAVRPVTGDLLEHRRPVPTPAIAPSASSGSNWP